MEAATTLTQERRGFYRLAYPYGDRPNILFAGRSLEVLEISEHGVRFLTAGSFQPPPGTVLYGEIIFRDGGRCPVAGKLLRWSTGRGAAVLKLSQGVPLERMMQEQRYIFARYGHEPGGKS